MNIRAIYQYLVAIWAKFRKNKPTDFNRENFEHLTVTLNGNVIPFWFGGENNLTAICCSLGDDDL